MSYFISLVIPVFNMETLICRCMDSFLKQTSHKFEIILVDDGSTDKSPELCEQYAIKYPDYIHVIHKQNGGLSSARNAGIDIASGTHVVFPDPDDWVEPNYVEMAIRLLEQTPDMVCLGHFIDYDDKTIIATAGKEQIILCGDKAQEFLLMSNGMSGFAWNKFYRLDLIRKHGLKFEDDTGTTEDLDFAYRYLAYCEDITYAPQYHVYHYYQRFGGATNSGFSHKKLDSIHTYQKIIKDTGNQWIKKSAREEICNWAINLTVLYKQAKTDDKNAWKQIRTYLLYYLFDYLKSKRYGMGRKTQAILALVAPTIYAKLKKNI